MATYHCILRSISYCIKAFSAVYCHPMNKVVAIQICCKRYKRQYSRFFLTSEANFVRDSPTRVHCRILFWRPQRRRLGQLAPPAPPSYAFGLAVNRPTRKTKRFCTNIKDVTEQTKVTPCQNGLVSLDSGNYNDCYFVGYACLYGVLEKLNYGFFHFLSPSL